MPSYMGHSCKKIQNSGRGFCDFLSGKGVRGICPLQADFSGFPFRGIWGNRSLCGNTGSACYSCPERDLPFRLLEKKLEIILGNAPIEGALLYLQLTSGTAEKGGEKVLDHAFQRRREIERMLLSGKKLTVSELMGRYCVGRKSISRDFEVIGEELPVISKKGYNGGYFLMDGVGKNQNTLSHEQLECLEKLAVGCTGKDRETVLSIIHEFGPYCERNT